MFIDPYRVVEETDTHVTYEYRTWCTYWMYASLAIMIAYIFTESALLFVAAVSTIGLYFVLVWLPALKTSRKIRASMKVNGAQLSGSRWSTSNPLTIRSLKVDIPEP